MGALVVVHEHGQQFELGLSGRAGFDIPQTLNFSERLLVVLVGREKSDIHG